MRKMKKGAFLLALSGVTLFSSCLGGMNYRQLLWNAAIYAGFEYATDGGLFDLFAEAAPAA